MPRFKWITVSISIITLSACGGGSSSDNTVTSNAPPPPPPPPAPMVGYLLNVKGVRFESCGGYKGYTGAGGVFGFAQLLNCTVSFSIGGMPLGSTVIADWNDMVITPYDLHQGTLSTDAVARTNILTLAQTLNARPNSRGVIEISSETDQLAHDAGWTPIDYASIDFNSIASAEIQKPLVDSARATSDYNPSVSCLHVGYFFGGTSGSVAGPSDSNGNPTETNVVTTLINGIATPDGNVWLALNRVTNFYSSDLASDYDRLSGRVIPTTMGLGFDAVGSKISSRLFFKSAFHLNGDVSLIGNGDWKGVLTTTQDQRILELSDAPPGKAVKDAPNWNDIPDLKFAGRTADTYLLSLEVYADDGVRVIVNNAIANTVTKRGDQALLRGFIDANDNVTATGHTGSDQEERSYKLVGKIDRAKMIFTGYVMTWTPTAPNPVLYMEFTEEAPAEGCAVFPHV